MITPNISKLELEFVHEGKNWAVPLYDEFFAASADVKKISVAGRKYIYEEDAKAPECVRNVLQSLSEAHPFSKKKEFVSYISQETKISQMSLTKSVYTNTIGENKLLKKTQADTDQLAQAKNSLCQALIQQCAPHDKKMILTVINAAEPLLNQPKVIFEIADQIEKKGSPELAHAVREAVRPFDLRSTLERVPELIADHYLDPGQGKMIAERLQGTFNSGKYEKFYDRMEFINELTRGLQEISQDKHVFMVDRQEKIDSEPEKGTVTVKFNKDFSYLNYLEFTKFENPNETEALKEIKHALDQIRESKPKEIIIDLRRNSGGSPYMMAYIASHFINPSLDLAQLVYRDEITEEELQTFPVAPVKTLSEEELPLNERMLEQPIFILTSNYSLSAAEALAYHLREHRQATLIGEITGGGAHTNKLFEVNDDFYVAVSFGDYVLNNGEKNWEEKGLLPDILVNGEEALHVAEEFSCLYSITRFRYRRNCASTIHLTSFT